MSCRHQNENIQLCNIWFTSFEGNHCSKFSFDGFLILWSKPVSSLWTTESRLPDIRLASLLLYATFISLGYYRQTGNVESLLLTLKLIFYLKKYWN